jgi:glutamate dehydrogenase (NAD(P)+)
VIGAAECERVRARVVAEAANVATLPEAEPRLAARGVVVVPDFVANLATNAWWWWTLFGDIAPEREPAFAKIAATMRRLVGELLDRAEAGGILPRAAAEAMAAENLERLAAGGRVA